MAFYRPKKLTLIVLIILTLPFLGIIADINCGADEPLDNHDLKTCNTQRIGYEGISVFFFRYVLETTHLEREHVNPVQCDRAPPLA